MKDVIKEFLQSRPVDEFELRQAVHELQEQNGKLKNAIYGGSENKHRYTGKVSEDIDHDATCVCGEHMPFSYKRKVPWAVIRDVLLLVQQTVDSK